MLRGPQKNTAMVKMPALFSNLEPARSTGARDFCATLPRCPKHYLNQSKPRIPILCSVLKAQYKVTEKA